MIILQDGKSVLIATVQSVIMPLSLINWVILYNFVALNSMNLDLVCNKHRHSSTQTKLNELQKTAGKQR